MRAGGLRKLPGKGQQAVSRCKYARVKHSFPPSFFPTTFVHLKRMWEMFWRPADFRSFWTKVKHLPWSKFRADKIQITLSNGMKATSLLLNGCLHVHKSIFLRDSDWNRFRLISDFKINCKAGSLRYSAFRMTRKGFYSSPNLPELKLVENFQLV